MDITRMQSNPESQTLKRDRYRSKEGKEDDEDDEPFGSEASSLDFPTISIGSIVFSLYGNDNQIKSGRLLVQRLSI